MEDRRNSQRPHCADAECFRTKFYPDVFVFKACKMFSRAQSEKGLETSYIFRTKAFPICTQDCSGRSCFFLGGGGCLYLPSLRKTTFQFKPARLENRFQSLAS
jgi:hypothetical protein